MPKLLECIETGEELTNLEEGLPDAHLFVVHMVGNHFSDIIHYLTTRMALEGYTSQQKKELVVGAAKFYVITGHFYKMGSDEILQHYVPDFE